MAFGGLPYGVLIVDVHGKVLFISPAAVKLLGVDPRSVNGAHCWELARLQSIDGQPFCSPDCPARRQLRSGQLESTQHLVYCSPSGKPTAELRLAYSTLFSPTSGTRGALLHLISPSAEIEESARPASEKVPTLESTGLRARAGGEPAPAAARDASDREQLPVVFEDYDLSGREIEVLEELAEGLGTSEIAERLFISPITVRKHVQNVMRKMHVHRRLDAVLVWMKNSKG